MTNILFLCTGNSARSILAEALATHLGAGRVKGYSAGSFPKGQVHPLSLALLKEAGLSSDGLRSKSWDEFAAPGAPAMDYTVTVCDQAAGEVCPVWPGRPVNAHWGLPDPAAVTGTPDQQMQAFREAYRIIDARVRAFLGFYGKDMPRDMLEQKMREVGTLNATHTP